ncbi:MAG TPA: anti-sigma factor [Solirubrobacteraceae bacterium]|nr:anti-sigma factor [Solirubrobacteraceae bacterium]
MTMTDHDRWADSAGAYVLGAMTATERDEFERHLAMCPTCREDVDELRPAAEALPMASPPVLPPPALKDRIMAEVEREAALLAQAGPAADRPAAVAERPRRRFRLPALTGWRLAPVAAALLIVGVLGGVLLTGGGSKTYPAGANAEIQVDGDKATLVATNMQAPPEGRVYEVWLVPKGAPEGAAPEPTNVLFVPRSDGAVEAAIPGSADDIAQVLVSDEPPGGSETPTGEVVMQADLS